MAPGRRTRTQSALSAVGVAALAGCLALYLFGSSLGKPAHRQIGAAPEVLPLTAVTFLSESGARLSGWLLVSSKSNAGVVLVHGIRADRTSMLDRAKFLFEAGYSVLLFDLQAHGESSGDRITFGALEALDVQAAVNYLRILTDGVGVIGRSLGGAACVLGPRPLTADALVLEAVYPDIRDAVRNRLRLRLGRLGAYLAPLLTIQIKPRIGISPDELRPEDRITDVTAPVLILGGEQDRRTTAEETLRLYEAAPEPKELWLVPGGRHEDLHRHAPIEYEKRVLSFLERYLKGQANKILMPVVTPPAGASGVPAA